MGRTVKGLLTDALEDLDERDFRKFRNKLIDRREEPRIRRGAIQNADFMDLADKMVGAFTEASVIGVAVELFREIGCYNNAAELEKSFTEFSGGASPTASPATMGASGVHFVDQHRSALVLRVNMVASIMDDLLARGVVTQEGYNLVLSKGTNEDKMRELYNGPLYASGTRGKDIFYEILVKKLPFLVEDLKT